MKPKDVGFFTQHVEKIILGLGVLVLLIVGILFGLGSPYDVNVRTAHGEQNAGPGDIEGLVRDQAQQLKRNLAKDPRREGGIPEPNIANYAREFNNSYRNPVQGVLAYHVPFYDRGVNIAGENTAQREFALPQPPMPSNVIARADHGVLDFDHVDNTQQLSGYRHLVGDETPADFRYVSVAASFDMDGWAKRFGQEPAQQRIPQRIYRNNLDVAGVYLLRQAKDPRTGKWQKAQVVEPLPGQIAFFPSPKGAAAKLVPKPKQTSFNDAQAWSAKQNIRQNQQLIARPNFPPLMGFNPWASPDTPKRGLSEKQQGNLARIKEQIRDKQDQIDTLKKRGQGGERNSNTRPRPNSNPRDDEGQRRRRGSQSEERARRERARQAIRGSAGSSNNDQTRAQARIERLQSELEQLKQKRDSIEQESGLSPNGDNGSANGPRSGRGQPGRARGQRAGGQNNADRMSRGRGRGRGRRGGRGRGPENANANGPNAGPQNEPGHVKVWAHDLSVKPDRTYRYKVVVTVLNPLFRRDELSKEQVKENKNRIALAPSVDAIESAQWSKPVHVAPKYYFFVVDGNAGENLAQVEVYRLFGGHWRMGQFDAQPGDSIGQVVQISGPTGQTKNVDMRVGAYMVDMESVAGAGAGGQILRMLYLDPLTDHIRSRDVATDREKLQRQRLHSLTQQRARANQAASAARNAGSAAGARSAGRRGNYER